MAVGWTRRVGELVVALVLASALPAGAQFPAGGEFQVNTYTTEFQVFPGVASEADGDFLVVWASEGSFGTDADSFSIQGQRHASSGSAQGSEFQVNTYTTGYQFFPAVATDPDGDFIVVWDSPGSYGTDTNSYSIQAQRYASDGSAQGGEFQVNTYTTSYQRHPVVAAAADGGFVVVWESFGSAETDTSFESIQGQRYASDGSTVGGEFQVNTYTAYNQYAPAVAVAPSGDFVVVWHSSGSYGSDTSYGSIEAQRYASDGSAVGAEFQVNTYTTDAQELPAVAIDASGGFVVVWQSAGSAGTDASGRSVQGRRYASDGAAQGDEFQINTYTTNGQYHPSVAMDAGGGFVVAWENWNASPTDPTYSRIQGRLYASDGSPVGEEFLINTYTGNGQIDPAVSAAPAGDFVVVWHGFGPDADWNVAGQRYTLTAPPHVPSLSPGAAAAVALLMLAVVAFALRRSA